MTKKLIAAIDTPELDRASDLVRNLSSHCGMVKLGLEFFLRHGPAGFAQAVQGNPVFLDLKLHDIPNTVAGAVRSLLPLGADMLTIHAVGGAKMIAAAAEVAHTAAQRPKILAVTVLTSLDAAGLAEIGVAGGTAQQVLRLARLALENGADGLVCSAHEISLLRDAFGAKPILVVPGIRPAGAALGDQARVMTPEQAVQAGADYIVVGRPITEAADPAAAAAAIAATIR
ncbi:MAG TPA: orotidine-5'-phosphate decarboxylase [Acidocella sp.]|jgi:orotidine-5'-phosphate decarboxylase|nr:orotidine-5'-phosphate decarboxylase [Acidocella sp.]